MSDDDRPEYVYVVLHDTAPHSVLRDEDEAEALADRLEAHARRDRSRLRLGGTLVYRMPVR